MVDILDINNSIDLGTEEDGDSLARLKNKVKRRKGRGFQVSRNHHEKIKCYEGLKDDDNSPGPQKSVEGWILFVTGVHEEATEEDLHEKFAEYGNIKNIHVNLDRRTGFLKGYSLIEYEYFDEANNARIALDGSELLGQSIDVNWCFVKSTKKTPKKDAQKPNLGAGDN